jgi:hypothetical protein
VLPLWLVGLGVVVCLIAGLLLRRIGPGFRIARVLAAAPEVSIDEIATAVAGGQPYVRVHGRISSDEEFPDELDRPLVYRRRRLELAIDASQRRWRTLEDEVMAVPFGLEERTAFVAVDAARLDEGLAVIVRVTTRGRAPDRSRPAPPIAGAAAPIRRSLRQGACLRIGAPRIGGGEPMIWPGPGGRSS